MIVKLQAPLKDYVWGGIKLKTEYGKQSASNIAESWELSFCDGSESIVASGKYCGKPISQVTTRADWGKNCNNFEAFPVLVKLIDAKQNLSVQVHPSDSYALEHENQYGKTEMWHILQAEEGAKIYLGLNQTVTKQQFQQAVADKTVCNLLNAVPVKAGETYFVESGTLHAIGAGVTLIEIQQNSTLTYRVYDYDRRGADGKPRQLHLEKALTVANFNKYDVPNPQRKQHLGGCKYFSAYKYSGEHKYTLPNSFSSITVTDGSISINGSPFEKGETAFISAGKNVEVVGDGSWVLTCVE